MPAYGEMTAEQLALALDAERTKYEEYKRLNLKLDMSRGKPGADQLDLSAELLDKVSAKDPYIYGGMDVRNYGLMDGLPEMKKLFAEIMQVEVSEVVTSGNSSLNLMYDMVSYCFTHGVPGGEPWSSLPKVKVLCPSPGYDRHFAVTEFFGCEMIPVTMTENGPDISEIRALIKDESVKAMWCVPKYSNPNGITYSDETVKAIAALKPAAADFRIFWDDAYCVHHLYEKEDSLLPILTECRKNGSEDMVFTFASTSKVTFPGAGVAAVAASESNIAWLKKRISIQTIGPDKINQLRHLKMLPDLKSVNAHMKKHAEILRPKFKIVLDTLDRELAATGTAHWKKPNGGYFISVNVVSGTAKRVVELCREAGVVLTPAGATFPYGKDPNDRNIRLAPTFPPVHELQSAADIFCCAVKIAAAETLYSSK